MFYFNDEKSYLCLLLLGLLKCLLPGTLKFYELLKSVQISLEMSQVLTEHVTSG